MTFYSNPKVKTYGVLNPRGKALYEDSGRFGTKMLEKMGWSKGKGLGANLDGSLNFIKVAHKDDQKGMGFKDRDDQWTQHEDNFNALLKSFNTNNGDSNKSNSDSDNEETPGRVGFGFKVAEPKPTKEAVFSGVSLEEQSKKSRSRVHYKKFTRGKDMARYSEQDLANIFGKKSLGDKHALAIEAESAVKEVEKEEDGPENTFGVTVIQTGLSVSDYFKAKMETMKQKRGPVGEGSSNPFDVYDPEKNKLEFRPEDMEEYPAFEEIPEYQPEEKNKNKRKRSESEDEIKDLPNAEAVTKKKKKSKKSKRSIEEAPLNDSENVNLIDATKTNTEDVILKKKKKKKSKEAMENVLFTDETGNALVENDSSNLYKPEQNKEKKHKKSKKNKHQDENKGTPVLTEIEEPAIEPPKKKKKKSREVIPTQPLHFPKFVSNVLTSLYDPNITDVGSPELSTDRNASNPPTPSTTTTTTLNKTFELAKFKAEVFRFFDLEAFVGSSLGDLAGYGYSKNLELKVVTGYKDDTRITNFWDTALINKYGSDVIQLKKKTKKKKYNINVLQKKNVFKF